ncbi:MAG: acyl-CoA dehydrogenase C-terminal domain-containing protein [Parvibaculaceae bacterium]|nr:acyl-CoA dehydrogenase C-terminal domain-containing protein [Parvibaculaceae bacterium]
MPLYQAPIRDYQFVLHEVLNTGQYANLPSFADASDDLMNAILEEAAKLAQEVLLPLNQVGDEQGCKLENGIVRTPDGFAEAYKQMVDGGWPSLTGDTAYDGQGLPNVLATAVNEMISSSNMAFAMYPGLSHGVYSALHHHGSDELKKTYLPNLVSGEWTGTMNLTEPHCGTDLGLLRSKAVPQADGTFKISGQKIFISAGDHEMASNIIHLVLARVEGGPEGVGGISLFVVPKYLIQEDGSLSGERNGVSVGSLEKKMGIHGNATCVLNYDDAVGFIVGEENKGLRAMFTMMNEARLGVGMQGIAQSEIAYQNARDYALERVQGRSLTGPKNPEKPADPLIVHPDVRRILMTIRSFNEGARALMLWTALQGDLSHLSDDESVRELGDDMMALLTPVIKGHFTDIGFANCVDAQQVYGGHGYIDEQGMGQFVRDARIAQIYEGANGVQALDLVGRKLAMKGGRPVLTFSKMVDDAIAEAEADEALSFAIAPMKAAKKDFDEATGWFMENALKNFDHAGAGSTDFMHLLGRLAVGFMWLRLCKVAQSQLAAGSTDAEFYQTKLTLAQFYMERLLPETAVNLTRIKTGADTMMSLPAEAF